MAEIEQLVKRFLSLRIHIYTCVVIYNNKKKDGKKTIKNKVIERKKSYRNNTGQPRKQQPRINILILLKDHAKMSYIVKYMYVYILYVWRDYIYRVRDLQTRQLHIKMFH